MTMAKPAGHVLRTRSAVVQEIAQPFAPLVGVLRFSPRCRIVCFRCPRSPSRSTARRRAPRGGGRASSHVRMSTKRTSTLRRSLEEQRAELPSNFPGAPWISLQAVA